MDEQTNPTPEIPIITPDPVVADTPVVEPPQAEPAQAPAEPVAAPATPQMGGNEALAEIAPELAPQDAGAVAEAPKVEPPTALPTPTTEASPSEETPPKAEESPRTPSETPLLPQQAATQPEPARTPQTPQGTPQPEPVRQHEPPESVPAQAPVAPTPSRNVLKLIFQKGLLTIKLRKQKKLIKVMGLFATKKSITNDDVEKLLHVSDTTASRYLTQLKKENKIIQVGKTGQGVTYTKR